MERHKHSGPGNRTVSVMARMPVRPEYDPRFGGNTMNVQYRPARTIHQPKTKRQGCAAKICKSPCTNHSQSNSISNSQSPRVSQDYEEFIYENPPLVRPASVTSIITATNVSNARPLLSFQEPNGEGSQSTSTRSTGQGTSNPYSKTSHSVPSSKQQQPIVCICTTGQNRQSISSALRQSLQQQVAPSYLVPPYATHTENRDSKNSTSFCSSSSSKYKFISPCKCGQYHEYQAQLLLPRQIRQASSIFQRVPAPMPTPCQVSPPLQICWSAMDPTSYSTDPNYLIREQPTRDSDIEAACMCTVPATMPTKKKSSSFKVSPLGYANVDVCGCAEQADGSDTICLPCGHTFPEGPKDTTWRVKIMKDVGIMTKGLEFGIQTQTYETRIIDADKLEGMLLPEERFHDYTIQDQQSGRTNEDHFDTCSGKGPYSQGIRYSQKSEISQRSEISCRSEISRGSRSQKSQLASRLSQESCIAGEIIGGQEPRTSIASHITDTASQRSGYPGEGTSQRSGYPGEGASQRSGYPGGGASQRSGYSGIGASQRSGYPADGASQRSGYPSDGANQRSSYLGEGGSQRSGYPGDGASQRSGYPGEGASQRSGYLGEGASQRSGYPGDGTSLISEVSGYPGEGTSQYRSSQDAYGEGSYMEADRVSQTSCSSRHTRTSARSKRTSFDVDSTAESICCQECPYDDEKQVSHCGKKGCIIM